MIRSVRSISIIPKKKIWKNFKHYISKKRFIVSRTVLKHILRCLLKLESILDISTYKDRYGEVHILNHEELHICISYSEDIVALAVSKTRVGIDIEAKRPLALKKIL